MASKIKQKIVPFLWYVDKAEEAARFYTSIFPDSNVDRVTTMQAESPSGPPGSVKVVDFTLFSQPFQAMTAGPLEDGSHEFNHSISFMVNCENQGEVDRYWGALLEGGGKPEACGWLEDRYGVRWQITPTVLNELMADPDKDKARRVAEAMMKMVKIDIATLIKAAEGR